MRQPIKIVWRGAVLKILEKRGKDMNFFLKMMKMTALVGMTVLSVGSVSAQDKSDRTVEQFSCKDILRESGESRNVAVAFLHGYMLGKSGSSKFNVAAMAKQTDQLIDRCLENPGEKLIEAMAKVQK